MVGLTKYIGASALLIATASATYPTTTEGGGYPGFPSESSAGYENPSTTSSVYQTTSEDTCPPETEYPTSTVSSPSFSDTVITSVVSSTYLGLPTYPTSPSTTDVTSYPTTVSSPSFSDTLITGPTYPTVGPSYTAPTETLPSFTGVLTLSTSYGTSATASDAPTSYPNTTVPVTSTPPPASSSVTAPTTVPTGGAVTVGSGAVGTLMAAAALFFGLF
ncbi:hypothetical protein F5X99DRAFT_102637 [Biscogniauxia marginata]|nr:hypothetical protein F5X99DRAFT_102637 [Biscogniauxia marginata]